MVPSEPFSDSLFGGFRMNLLNQINRKQAYATLVTALLVGGAASITALAADLPKYVDVSGPLGAALLAALFYARAALNSGSDK
jgi:hypothetical protein